MPVTPPPIVSPIVGELPDRGQTETQFDTNQQNFVNYQANFGPEINDLADWTQETADQTEDWANEAEASALASSNSAGTAVTTANFKGAWSSLSGALAVPATVYHSGKYWQLLENIGDVATEQPGVSTKWSLSARSNGRTVVVSPITLAIPDRFFVKGVATVTVPTGVGQADGTVWDFVFETPSLTSKIQPAVAGQISTRLGDFDAFVMNKNVALELVISSGKYRT